jgi:hypothetical protein
VTVTAEQQQRAAAGGEGKQAAGKNTRCCRGRDAAGVEDWKAG